MTNKEMIDVITAFESGEKIEFSRYDTDFWLNTTEPEWDFSSKIYRVKPKEAEMVTVYEVIEKAHDNWYVRSLLHKEEDIPENYMKTGREFKVPKE